MTEKSEKTEKTGKAPRKPKDVDALLTEVTGAIGKGAVKPEPAAKKAVAKAEVAPKQLRIRQVRSGICAPQDQKKTLEGLGLRKIRQEVVRADNPSVRGQVHKIRHLVEIIGE